jgi:hypothetical protein
MIKLYKNAKVILGNVLFKNYGFSEFSLIGNKNYGEYISLLNPHQTKVYKVDNYLMIEWNDPYTMYITRFNLNGEFISIEREMWFEYKMPFFTKVVIYDSNLIIKK